MGEDIPLLYKNFISFEEWLVAMKGLLSMDQVRIHRYKELYLSKGVNEKKREGYHELILEYAKNVALNLVLIEAAEIENDLMVFYIEDGQPCTASVTEEEKKKLDQKMQETKELYGR